MQTILVPVDFSRVTRALVGEAVRLSLGKPSKIILLHVVAPPPPIGYPDPIVLDMGPLLAAMIKSGAGQLRKLKAALNRRNIPVRVLQLEGIPVVEILDCARKSRADYIVIGSHGHSGFYDLLIGSTTSGILKRSTCPVVVVPAMQSNQRL
jgi:nucleotide-binding universal stress UspA family protein